MNHSAFLQSKALQPEKKVFGIGWAKTGTTTLGRCLQILGYRHTSQRRDLVSAYTTHNMTPILEVAREADSFEDWPWILLYRELNEAFPDSYFILTIREPLRWLASYRNMLKNPHENTEELHELRRQLYNLNFPSVTDEQLVKRYNEHNSNVINYFDKSTNKLLIVNWEQGHGWSEICQFLGKTPPNTPLPHENQGSYQ